MESTLHTRIAALRKERGLTQEQLGQLVGVSAQAVSKWEKGGAPDVELLPVLADRLGVSIDALFGRAAGERLDVYDAVARWLREFPHGQRPERLCELVCRSLYCFMGGENIPEAAEPMKTCQPYRDGGDGRLMLNQFQCWGGGGIALSLYARDMSFATLWPQPEEGYAKWLAPRSEYRRLFEVLSRPGCLELLWHLHKSSGRFFTPAAVAKRLSLPRETLEELMEALTELQILNSFPVEVEEGAANAYMVVEPLKFIPFFYLARCFMQRDLNRMRYNSETLFLAPDDVWPDEPEPD